MSVTIQLTGDKELVQKFKRMGKASKVIIQHEMDQVTKNIVADAKARLSANKSIEKAPIENSFYIKGHKGKLQYEVGNRAYNAPFVEFGTKTGNFKTPATEMERASAAQFRGKKFFFWNVARNIMRTMGYNKSEAASEARKIGKFGSPAFPYFFPAVKYEWREFEKRFNKILHRITSS